MKCINCGDPGCVCLYCLRAMVIAAGIVELIHFAAERIGMLWFNR